MLKTLNRSSLLTRVCQVPWCSGRGSKDWQTWVIILMHEIGDRSECTNYRDVSLLSLPGTVDAKCREKRCPEVIEPKMKNARCGFVPSVALQYSCSEVCVRVEELNRNCSPLVLDSDNGV